MQTERTVVKKSVTNALRVLLFVASCFLTLAATAYSQATPEVPSNFKADMEAAARLRPQMVAQSAAATGRYATGRIVFEQLVSQADNSLTKNRAWELRIVADDQLNAISSPDGTVYVQSGLAKLAGANLGLWAAILSHEIAHIIRRDWARRYLYQQYLESRGSTGIILGDPSLPTSSTWSDAEKASAEMARFCRQLELEADIAGLMLMARAGYHPDFVPALHHLLRAQGREGKSRSLYAMHPCWEERDRELSRAYITASIEFDRHWPDWYASPGGNPPVVVFAEEPMVRKVNSNAWEIRVPMHCQNLAGAVEVVLRTGANVEKAQLDMLPADTDSSAEIRQLTGCTSPKTTITFTLDSLDKKSAHLQTDVFVLDAMGSVLARADVPKLPH